jgi:seryl-tRNA synthetase
MPKHKQKPSNTDQSSNKSTPKFSKIDKAAILIAKDNPTLNNHQIAKKVMDLGISKDRKSVHNRWYKNDYLRREITEVRNRNLSELQRKHVPKALKKLNKLLNEKEDKKLQLQAVNTTLKYGMGEIINAPSPGISVGAIENAQIFVNSALDTADSGNNDTQD